MWGRAGRTVKLLGRNIPSILRMTKGVDVKISRRLCVKPQEESQLKPRSQSPLRVPGHKPTDWEKKFLLWAGHFKKPEDIPETVSIETIRAAKTTLRVKFSYVMMALTILGCILMVIKGKQATECPTETLELVTESQPQPWELLEVSSHISTCQRSPIAMKRMQQSETKQGEGFSLASTEKIKR